MYIHILEYMCTYIHVYIYWFSIYIHTIHTHFYSKTASSCWAFASRIFKISNFAILLQVNLFQVSKVSAEWSTFASEISSDICFTT